MKVLSGKVAVITGGAAGIGLALGRACAAHGMTVVLADRDGDGAAQAAASVGGAYAVAADVTVPEDVERLAETVYREHGAANLLCNNAGVLGRILPSWDQPAQNWRWVFDVNVFGVVHGIQSFLPRMIESSEEGYVLNTASIAGMISGPFFAPYNASKHAVVALTECLHHELRAIGSKIEAGVLCPGWVKTGLADLESKLPGDLQEVNAARKPHPLAEQRDRAVREMVASSTRPEAIAEAALEAVREGRFYVFPHPERKEDVRRRMEDIVEERVPVFGAPPKR